MNTKADLIARLEAATEGSRELDAAIGTFIDPVLAARVFDRAYAELTGELINADYFPSYTSSLDAAMTLVPDGLMVSVARWMHCEAGTWHWSARIGPVCRVIECDELHESEATTAPLALCSVALKYRTSTP